MIVAPIVAARFTAVARLANELLFPSTSRILQLWQMARATSTSREISRPQPESGGGSGLAAPFWLTFLKQPLAVVQAGSPKVESYVARSDSMLGASKASTIAIV